MPNATQKRKRFAMVRATTAGPANYNNAARPTLQMPCKELSTDLREIQMWADQGLLVRPVSVVGNVITYMILSESRAAQAGALQDHAAHTHDLLIIKNAGAADQVEVGAATFQSDGATATVIGGAVTGGVQKNAAAQAHVAAAAALKDIPFAEEVRNASNFAAFNIYAKAYARVR